MKRATIAFLLFFCSFATALSQQAATATLSGRITDPTGAVIVGANVTIIRKDTGIERHVTTNSEGLYVLANLSPGKYEVKIQATNFAQSVTRLVELNVGQQIMLDATLQASGPSETII
jgi:hypothetical protein